MNVSTKVASYLPLNGVGFSSLTDEGKVYMVACEVVAVVAGYTDAC